MSEKSGLMDPTRGREAFEVVVAAGGESLVAADVVAVGVKSDVAEDGVYDELLAAARAQNA